MYSSLFSNRYNKKRKIYYERYEETRQRYPNLPFYKRAAEPSSCKSPKCGRQKRKPADYDYDDWIAGHFVSIVVRRAIEELSCCQLMEPSRNSDAFSWRCWPGVEDEPRRSLRLADRPSSGLKPSQIEWEQQLAWPALDLAIKDGSSHGQQALTLIDGCQLELESVLECNMCCKHFGQNGDLQLHSLDECRKYLLATLPN